MRAQAAFIVLGTVIGLAGLSRVAFGGEAPEGAGVMTEQLAVTAQSLGQALPPKVDDALTLSSVSADGLILTYHYKFTDPAVKAGERVAELNNRNLAQSCHHPGMRQMMKVFDVAFVYSYAPYSGDAPIDEKIDEKACIAYDQSRWK